MTPFLAEAVPVNTQITSNPAVQNSASIFGNKVVWQDHRNGAGDIYFYNLATGQEFQITSDPNSQEVPDIHKNKIVWQDNRNGNPDIYLVDLANGQETQITTDPSVQAMPSVQGNKIVYYDQRNGNFDIYLYNLTTNQETRITTNTSHQLYPAVYGDKIVWQDNRNGNVDIYLYNLTTNQETQITTDPGTQSWPSIYGNKVVWYDNRNGNWDIYMKNLTDNQETQITTDQGDQYYPSIYGNYVVWHDFRSGSNFDIYENKITNNQENQITDHAASQFYPDVYGNKIVWQDGRNGNDDIYMADMGAPVNGFGAPVQGWNSGPGQWEGGITKPVSGDFDGDGSDEAAALYEYPAQRQARLFVWFSNGVNGFDTPQIWWDSGPDNWDGAGSQLVSGDFNSDGRSDLAVLYNFFAQRQAKAFVFSSTGTGFNAPGTWWNSGPNNWDGDGSQLTSGDFTGDGTSDLAVLYNFFAQRQAKAFIFSSNGAGFTAPDTWWNSGPDNWDAVGAQISSGDYNGSGVDDLAVLYGFAAQRQAKVFVYPSNGSGFNTPGTWWDSGPNGWAPLNSRISSGDYNGDGVDDLLALYGYSADQTIFFTFTSTASFFNNGQGWWQSGQWSGDATKIFSGDYSNTDAIDEVLGFYSYGGSQSALFLFE